MCQPYEGWASAPDGYPPLVTSPGEEEAVRRQRVGAYAVCVRDDSVLLAQLSHRTGWPGGWTLPGGGVDHGEHPREAVVREVHEETGLQVEVRELLEVDSIHFTGHAPDGTLEDYHSIRLLYRGEVSGRDEPRVLEVDGSTSAAAWIPLSELDSDDIEVVALVRTGLEATGVDLRRHGTAPP